MQDRNSHVFSLFQTPSFSYRAGAALGVAIPAMWWTSSSRLIPPFLRVLDL